MTFIDRSKPDKTFLSRHPQLFGAAEVEEVVKKWEAKAEIVRKRVDRKVGKPISYGKETERIIDIGLSLFEEHILPSIEARRNDPYKGPPKKKLFVNKRHPYDEPFSVEVGLHPKSHLVSFFLFDTKVSLVWKLESGLRKSLSKDPQIHLSVADRNLIIQMEISAFLKKLYSDALPEPFWKAFGIATPLFICDKCNTHVRAFENPRKCPNCGSRNNLVRTLGIIDMRKVKFK